MHAASCARLLSAGCSWGPLLNTQTLLSVLPTLLTFSLKYLPHFLITLYPHPLLCKSQTQICGSIISIRKKWLRSRATMISRSKTFICITMMKNVILNHIIQGKMTKWFSLPVGNNTIHHHIFLSVALSKWSVILLTAVDFLTFKVMVKVTRPTCFKGWALRKLVKSSLMIISPIICIFQPFSPDGQWSGGFCSISFMSIPI